MSWQAKQKRKEKKKKKVFTSPRNELARGKKVITFCWAGGTTFPMDKNNTYNRVKTYLSGGGGGAHAPFALPGSANISVLVMGSMWPLQTNQSSEPFCDLFGSTYPCTMLGIADKTSKADTRINHDHNNWNYKGIIHSSKNEVNQRIHLGSKLGEKKNHVWLWLDCCGSGTI